jgi:ABC-type polysaccharide/polyol phosphate export permease
VVAPAALIPALRGGAGVLPTLRAAVALERRARLARIRRRALGPPGEALAPLWPLLVYLPLVAGGALPHPPDGLSPLVYAALGYLTWSLLVDATLAPTRGLSEHTGPGAGLGLGPAPRLLAGALEAGWRTALRALVLPPLAALAAPDGLDPLGLGLALLMLLPGLALAAGIGLILALWLAPWHDGAAGVATALRLTLLPSLVLFPLPEATWATALTLANPLALWTEAARALALGGAPPHALALTAWSGLGLGLLLLALRALARLAPALREAPR